MASNQPTAASTRERVLESAFEVFTEKGFRDTRIAEICERAEANVAAVNYYFGDKEKLYDQVWRHAFEITNATYPVACSEDADIPPEKRLRSVIGTMLHRIFDKGPAHRFCNLMMQEMGDPTGALDNIVKEVIHPVAMHVRSIVAELLGEGATEDKIGLCAMSIISQYVIWNFNKPIRQRLGWFREPEGEEIDKLADHMTRFGLAGIREYTKGEK